MRFYGAAEYRGAHWPTSDRIIPWQRFVVMVEAMGAIESLEQLTAVQAVQHGTLAADNPKDSAIRRATDALMRAAFPVVDRLPRAGAATEETM